MFQATEYLQTMRRINKFHDECIQCICEQYGLTKMEATIITFLKNNPGLDTAADMAELRALSKSHISQAVESLCQKGLLARTPDRADRRKMHLSLLPPAGPITESIDQLQDNFGHRIFQGFSESDLETFSKLNRQIIENVKQAAGHSDPEAHHEPSRKEELL